ncbi:MAG: pilus assembly protein N-terminal domain-containing protein [Bradyrhizobiaceae bacterium]|nr:pilus assembly protein N-terminal domain-containing protein [Bradyrhizobiaceae bacterium]
MAPDCVVKRSFCEGNNVSATAKGTFAVICALLSVASALPAAADTIDVVLDQAKILRLPERVATLVIGNPSVADGTLQTGGLLVVTGKNYGTTNLIALDPSGEILAEHTITVGAPKDGTLTVWRGVARETWSCAPKCEQSVMLGDDPGFFSGAMEQAQSRAGQASSRPSAAK